MSLIERAAGRILETGREISKPVPAEASESLPSHDSAIERAAAKLHATQPEVLTPTHQEAAPPAHHGAPSMLDLTRSRHEPTLSQVSPQGIINLARLKQAGMITPDGERTTIAEEYRQIKRP